MTIETRVRSNSASSGGSIGSLIFGGTPGSVLFVDSSGNLGQDNAAFNWNDSTKVFTLKNAILHLDAIGGGDMRFLENGVNTFGIFDGIDGAGKLSFYAYGLGGTAMTLVGSSGNIGIGTTSPSQKLEVSGSGATRIAVTDTGDGTSVLLSAQAGSAYLFTTTNSPLNFSTNNSAAMMTLDTSGKVGIGNASPGAMLHVDSATASNKGLILRSTDNSTTNKITEWQNSSGTALNSIGAAGKTFWGNVDTGAAFNYYGGGGGALPVARYQMAAPVSGDIIADFIHNGTVTGSITAIRAVTSCTGNGTFQMIQSGAGNAVYQISNYSTGDTQIIFDFNGSITNFSMGVDQSDSGKFKICTGNVLGTNDKFVMDTSGNASLTGLVSKYNNASTTGWGVPAIVGSDRKTGLTAAQALATYTVGAADASYEVSANVLVTTATLHSFTVTCTYTDEGNTSRTLTLNFSTLAGALTPTIANGGGAAPYEGVPLHIRCKAATTIIIASAAGGVYTTVTYNFEECIKQLA